MSDWNPNYVAYATVQGRTPEAQLAHDRQGHEAGNALPFVLWISAQRRAFAQAHPEHWDAGGQAIRDLKAWGAWLQEQARIAAEGRAA